MLCVMHAYNIMLLFDTEIELSEWNVRAGMGTGLGHNRNENSTQSKLTTMNYNNSGEAAK